jgi:predicted nucleic acid-binding protein
VSGVDLVADTSVFSYIFRKCPLGRAYEDLIDCRSVGITGQSIAELRAGAVMAQWGERRLAEHSRFLDRFTHVPDTREMSELCGAIRAIRSRIGETIEWPDAWPAACAMWLDVPLVTHDTDHEGIAGLRVLTLHDEWQVRETDRGAFEGGPLLLRADPSRSFDLRYIGSAHQ